jgi:hypothetical protein
MDYGIIGRRSGRQHVSPLSGKVLGTGTERSIPFFRSAVQIEVLVQTQGNEDEFRSIKTFRHSGQAARRREPESDLVLCDTTNQIPHLRALTRAACGMT